MKRLIIVLPLAALTCVFLLRLNGDNKNPFSLNSNLPIADKESNDEIKYEDCIQHESLVAITHFLEREGRLPVGISLKEIDIQIQKYQASLDSTITNLSSIDAHSFLHKEYGRCKELILSAELSNLQTYYHLKIMEACYTKDKDLNESSQGSLAKL